MSRTLSALLSYSLSILVVAVKRLWSQRGLMLCIALGLLAAVTLVTSVPLYSDAVNYRLLRAELYRERARPPFAFLYQYVGTWSEPIDWSVYRPADEYMVRQAPKVIGLPLEQAVRHARTENLRLFPASQDVYADARNPLEWTKVGFVSGIQDHIEILEGRFPAPATAADESFEVLIHEALANSLGLQAGEEYILFGGQRASGESKPVQFKITISGVWGPRNSRESFWLYQPEVFEKTLLVPEETFADHIAPKLKNAVFLAAWYLIFDGQGIHTEDAGPLLARIAIVNRETENILPNVNLEVSPVEALQQNQRQVYLLTILLYVFALPIIGLVLYFIVLISSMAVQRQRYEIAVWRSRGTSASQVVGIYLLEGLLLAVLVLAASPFVARTVAQIMGNTRSFLSFVPRAPLPLRFSPPSLSLAGLAAGIALAASVIPALSASSHTIITYKGEIARSLRRPFWQRYFIDFFLLVPSLYGYYLLRQRGTISILGQDLTHGSDPFQNPLLFLVPTLFLFASALLSMRFFPYLIGLLAWLGARLPGTAFVLALRHLARSRHYVGPLLMVILTLGLAGFIASMAKTMERHLVDRVYYEVGADMRLVEAGERIEPEEEGKPKAKPAAGETQEEVEIRWFFLPVGEHLNVPGVKAAARLGIYSATALVAENRVEGRFLGIDREDFPQVALFRRDFASASLGALMNALAMQNQALLVSRSFAAKYGLDINDRLKLRTVAYGQPKDIIFTIAGLLDYFPTVYPEDGPFFVGNLEYFFQERGAQYPFDVLLKTDGRDEQQIVQGVMDLGLRVLSSLESRYMIDQEQAQPELGGTFGLLSIGFIAAVLMTLLGFLISSILSFRERLIQLGVLRTVGLSVGQMAAFLAGEQLILIATGIGVGTGLGIGASLLFVPYLQVRSGPHPQTPPFVVQMAWDDMYKIYALFGVMLLLAIGATIGLLIRMKVFEAIKLGETV